VTDGQTDRQTDHAMVTAVTIASSNAAYKLQPPFLEMPGYAFD